MDDTHPFLQSASCQPWPAKGAPTELLSDAGVPMARESLMPLVNAVFPGPPHGLPALPKTPITAAHFSLVLYSLVCHLPE